MKKIANKGLKAITLLLIAALFAENILPISANAQYSERTPGQKLQQAYEESIANFGENEEDESVSEEVYALFDEIQESMIISASEDGRTVYADFYAGCYINEKNKLVVCVTDPQRMEEPTEYVVYKLVEHSYNTLFAVQAEIKTLYAAYCESYNKDSEEYELLNAMAMFGIDEQNNAIVVSLSELNAEKMEIFEALFGQYDCIELEDLGGTYEDYVTYKPGRAIYIIHTKKRVKGEPVYTGCRGSMGYRAYRVLSNGKKQYGFVTAGHVVEESMNGLVYKSDKFGAENVIGAVEVWRNNSKIDAAFVRAKDGVTISRTVKYSNNKGGTSNPDKMAVVKEKPSMLFLGTKIYKVGSTTYKTSGTVDVKFDSKTGRPVYDSTAKSKAGDSGGIVYRKVGSEYYPVGIVQGGFGNKSTIIVLASQIAEILKVYPY